jgi:hypothetical protein
VPPPIGPIPGLAEGQVLSFSQTVAGSNCPIESEATELGQPITRYCTGGTFNGAPVDCIFGTGQNQELLSGASIADAAIPFDVTFTPTTLNVTCGPNNNDTWNFTIVGNQHLNLTEIDTSTLAVEAVSGQVNCDPVNTANTPGLSDDTLTCHINACQQNPALEDLGPIVCANRNPGGTTTDLTVTGTLQNGTPIFGEDLNHKTSGQCS